MTPERLTELLAHAERATNGQVQRDLLDLLAALDEARQLAEVRLGWAADLGAMTAKAMLLASNLDALRARIVTIVDEAAGPQPEQSIEQTLTVLKRHLFEQRQRGEKWRAFALAANAVIVRGEHRLSDDLAFAGYVAAKAAVGQ